MGISLLKCIGCVTKRGMDGISARKNTKACVVPRCGSSAHRLYTCPQRKGTKGRKEGRGDGEIQMVTLEESTIQQIAGKEVEPRLLHYPVKIGKENIAVLIDSGASVNAIDAGLVGRVGGVITGDPPGKLRFAD